MNRRDRQQARRERKKKLLKSIDLYIRKNNVTKPRRGNKTTKRNQASCHAKEADTTNQSSVTHVRQPSNRLKKTDITKQVALDRIKRKSIHKKRMKAINEKISVNTTKQPPQETISTCNNINNDNIMVKFCYYVACIGHKRFDTKLKILEDNIKTVHKDIRSDFDIIVNLYSTALKNKLFWTLSQYKFIKKIFIYSKKGVLTELFLTNPYNEKLKNYDSVMFIFDDIRIKNINIMHMMKLKKIHNIQLLSPKVLKSTHSFMNRYNDLTINNFLEIYCLICSPKDMKTFFSCYSIDNKWMWGVDFMFGHLKVRTGVINDYVVEHMLPSDSNYRDAHRQMNNYLRRHGFSSLKSVTQKYKAIQSTIRVLDK